MFAKPRPRGVVLAAGAIAVSGVALACYSGAHLHSSRQDPAQYASVRWTRASAWDIVRSYPRTTTLYSTIEKVGMYFVERPVLPFPWPPAPDSAARQPYREQLAAIAREARGRDALLLCYPPLERAPLDDDAREILQLRTIDSTETVVLYGFGPQGEGREPQTE